MEGGTVSFQMNAQVKRLEGRLVVYDGTLCLVVEVDELAGTARVSRGSEAGPEIITMSTLDLRDAFSAGAELLLDGLQNPKTFARVKKIEDKWFFCQPRRGSGAVRFRKRRPRRPQSLYRGLPGSQGTAQ